MSQELLKLNSERFLLIGAALERFNEQATDLSIENPISLIVACGSPTLKSKLSELKDNLLFYNRKQLEEVIQFIRMDLTEIMKFSTHHNIEVPEALKPKHVEYAIKQSINTSRSFRYSHLLALFNENTAEELDIDKIANPIDQKVKSTKPFIFGTINTFKQNSERLYKTGAIEKAISNIELALTLKKKSTAFYKQEKFEEYKTQRFFKEFQNEIGTKEPELDIHRNILDSIIVGISKALKDITLLFRGSQKIDKNISTKGLGLFDHSTKSIKIAREAGKVAETLSHFCLTAVAA